MLGEFMNLDRSKVLQEAREFNSSPVRPLKCRILLTRIIALLYQGEQFQTKEATNLFFSVTKLFQAKDASIHIFALATRAHC